MDENKDKILNDYLIGLEKYDFWNPDEVKQKVINSGYKVMDVGPKRIGKAPPPGIRERLKVILPVKVSDYKIFTFIANAGDGCLGGVGWVWGEDPVFSGRYNIDYNWCTIEGIEFENTSDGNQIITATFRNWSHCDARQARFFVGYKM